MLRCLAVAVLLGLLRVQDAPSEKDLGSFDEACRQHRWLEAAQRLEAWGAAHPRWSGFRERVYRLAHLAREFKAVERGAILALLRALQQREPELPADPGFHHAAEALLGWSLMQVSSEVVSASPPDLHLGIAPPADGARRPPSIVTAWWIPPAELQRARAAALADGAEGLPLWRRVPRARWTLQGRQVLTQSAEAGPELGIKPTGTYVLEEEVEGLVKRSPVLVSAWAVVVKMLPGELLVYTLRPRSGEPQPDVRIAVAAGGKVRLGRTGPDGLLRLAVSGPGRLIADLDQEFQELSLFREEAAEGSRVHISTDRPVYRPGQTVSFKALRRNLESGRLVLPVREKVRVEVRDPLGRSIHAAEPSWNEYGSVSGSLRLGDEPPLGTYAVLVHGREAERNPDDEDPPLWQAEFTVAAYRKPEMAVQVEYPAGAAVLGERLRAVVRASYHFGSAVAGGEVDWSVSRRVPWRLRALKRLPELDPSRAWFFQPPDETDDDDWSPYREGKTALQPDGSCEVEFDAEELEGSKGSPHEFRVTAVVTDLSRFQAEGSAKVLLLPASLRVDLDASRQFARPGHPLEVRVRAASPDGRPLPAQEVELTAYTERAERGPDGEVEFELFYRGTARSGEDGRAAFTVSPEPGPRLRLRARAKDERGRWAVDRLDLPLDVDASDRDADHEEIAVVPERRSYEAGDTARLLLRAPRKGLSALLTVEGEGFLVARILALKQRTETLELPVGADWPRRVVVKLCAWKDGAAFGGGATMSVYPRDGVLDVRVAADKASYAPREKARVSISTSALGAGVPAEVELSIVDESIFGLRMDKTEDLRSFFHRRSRRDAGVDGTIYVPDDYLDGEERRPLAGALVGAMFALEEAKGEAPGETNEAVRSEFPDTLLWRAHALTDAQGKAEIEIEIPDSLTTWRFTARAVSGASRFGEARSTALCRKDVMLRLAAPRFFTERDLGTVSTIVHNERREDAVFRVRLEAEGLDVEAGEKELRVPAGGARRLDWTVLARHAGSALLRARAAGPAGGDAMELRLPVLPHGLEDATGVSGAVDGAWSRTLALPANAIEGSAVLEASICAPGTSAVLDALPYLAGYPYGCVEQTMSRFLPSVVAARTLKRLGIANPALEKELPHMVARGLERLYAFQHEDGGWGWWKEDDTHPFMTSYAMYGLLSARAAGFDVRDDVLKNGLERVEAFGFHPLGAWVRAAMGKDVSRDPAPESQEDLAWMVLAGRKDLAAKLERRPPAAGKSDDIRRVALTIRALHAADPADPQIGKLVEWLMLMRQGAIWNSTLDTAYAVFALCDLAAGRPDPSFTVRVNGRETPAPGGRLRVAAEGLRAGANVVEIGRRGEGLLFASALLRWRSAEEGLKPAAGALEVTRHLERMTEAGQWAPLESGAEVPAGQDLRVTLRLRAPRPEARVMLECPLPAGAEPREDQPGAWDERSWYARRELRDDRVCLAVGEVTEEVLEFSFRMRPVLPGEYHVMPARAFAMYDPDRRGYSGEFLLRVRP